jgi:hypothetical protein
MILDYKNLIGVVLIVAILVAVSGCINTNNTNNTPQNITQNNNSSVKNTTTEISATKAKALAKQFTGIGVTLGTPKLTTFKGVKVWSVPVSTVGENKSVDNIYINAVTGKRVQ